MRSTRTPLKAIRAKCLDCSCHQPREVKECRITSCPLWPYRLGRICRIEPKPGSSRKERTSLTKEKQIESPKIGISAP